MKLVIVESPTKCTTIKRYLGDEYEVKASLGHICDLATSGKGGLGVDVDNNFKPIYVISNKKHHVVNELTTLLIIIPFPGIALEEKTTVSPGMMVISLWPPFTILVKAAISSP